ncbi:MAG: c-type cytochrome [Granulosicoccaceae bacterium]
MKKLTNAALMLCLLIAGSARATNSDADVVVGDAAAGEAAAAVCGSCHGADGKALVPNYPNLGGQHASYTAKQITEFREGIRENAVMAGMAAALTDQGILDIAAYYASLPVVKGIASEENLKAGEDIFRGGVTAVGIPGCMGCHGPNGSGNPAAGFPALAGQNSAYIIEQLTHFRAGTRANDAGEMMRSIAKRLSDDEIAAVANYISGLH